MFKHYQTDSDKQYLIRHKGVGTITFRHLEKCLISLDLFEIISISVRKFISFIFTSITTTYVTMFTG